MIDRSGPASCQGEVRDCRNPGPRPLTCESVDDPMDRFKKFVVMRASAVLDGVGLTTPLRRDAALGVVLALLTVMVLIVVAADPTQAGSLGGGPFTVPVVIVLLAAQALALTLRRCNPVLCLGVVIALQVVLAAVVTPTDYLVGPAPLIAAYTCGAWLPARRALVAAAIAALVETLAFVGFLSLAALEPQSSANAGTLTAHLAGQALSSGVTYLVATVLGSYVATRRRYVEVTRARAAEAVEVERARTEAAVRAERTRMARELNDIAAHHLAAMVIQASMAEMQISRDWEAARRHAVEVRTQGRVTLRALRLAVETLRERGGDGAEDGANDGVEDRADSPEDGAPVPGLAVLDELVARTRAAGASIELHVAGTPQELPSAADVSFYRVAQEALANARDHAPDAPVTVRVEHRDTATVLEVRQGPGESTHAFGVPDEGFGLVAMRERADLIGATLDACPTGDGGWRVRLELAGTQKTE